MIYNQKTGDIKYVEEEKQYGKVMDYSLKPAVVVPTIDSKRDLADLHIFWRGVSMARSMVLGAMAKQQKELMKHGNPYKEKFLKRTYIAIKDFFLLKKFQLQLWWKNVNIEENKYSTAIDAYVAGKPYQVEYLIGTRRDLRRDKRFTDAVNERISNDENVAKTLGRSV